MGLLTDFLQRPDYLKSLMAALGTQTPNMLSVTPRVTDPTYDFGAADPTANNPQIASRRGMGLYDQPATSGTPASIQGLDQLAPYLKTLDPRIGTQFLLGQANAQLARQNDPQQQQRVQELQTRQKVADLIAKQQYQPPDFSPVNVSPMNTAANGNANFNYGGAVTPPSVSPGMIRDLALQTYKIGGNPGDIASLLNIGKGTTTKLGKDEILLGENGQTIASNAGPDTFSEAPHRGINPATGNYEMALQGRDGSTKWLGYDSPPPPNPNQPFNPDGSPNGAYQDYKRKEVAAASTGAKWQILTDPSQKDSSGNAVQYRYNPETAQATDLNGNAFKPSGAAKLANAGTQQLFSDAQATLFAEQALAGDKSVFATVGRNQAARTQVAQKVADLAAQRGVNGADIAAANAAFAGDTRAQQTIGQRTGAIAVSGAEAEGVAGLVKDAYAKLPRGQFRPFNQLASLYANQTNSPEQGAAYAADFSLQTAYARALNPQGVPRETDIAKVAELLNGADSFEKHDAVVDQILREIKVIQSSTGAARIAQINKTRNQIGLGPVPPGGGVPAPFQAAPGGAPAPPGGSGWKVERVQ